MSRKVFVFTDVNYGASKSNAAANSATDPYDLAVGSIGVYGIDPSDANNKNKTALITDGGSSAAGLVPAANFVGEYIQVALGTLDGCIITDRIKLSATNSQNTAYDAPVKRVRDIGYTPDNTANSLNIASTILRGDEFTVVVNERGDKDNSKIVGRSYSGYALSDGDSVYNILADLIGRNNDDQLSTVEMEVFGDGAISTIATTIAVVNGSKQITFGAAQTLAKGSFIALRNSIYKITSDGASSTTATIDRDYVGSSETIPSSTSGTGTTVASTEYGLRLTDKEEAQFNEVSLQTGLESADNVVEVDIKIGAGSPRIVRELEVRYRPNLGRLDNRNADFGGLDSEGGLTSIKTNSSKNYDMYILETNDIFAGNGNTSNGHAKAKNLKTYLAFEEGVANTSGKNQSDFEDIMNELLSSFVTLF